MARVSEGRDWATVEYRFDLTDDEATDFVRVRLRIEQGSVVRFTVQYETVVDGQVYPVVRYDTAHGTAHRDRMDRRGRVVEKMWMPGRSYAEIATEAIATIKASWQREREDFLGRKR